MKLMCDGYSSDGVMSILILNDKGNTSSYEYKVDAARIQGWRERILHNPHHHGIVLNEIKHNATWFKRIS